MAAVKALPWEKEIVSLIADGFTVPEIGVKLGINKRTLEKKVFDLKSDYGVKTLAALAVLFFRKKYIK